MLALLAVHCALGGLCLTGPSYVFHTKGFSQEWIFAKDQSRTLTPRQIGRSIATRMTAPQLASAHELIPDYWATKPLLTCHGFFRLFHCHPLTYASLSV